MSRVGKNPIVVPQGVTVTNNADIIEVKGKIGKDNYKLPIQVTFEQNNNIILIKSKSKEKLDRMMWGTAQSILSNMITSVNVGATVKLELSGVGYKGAVQGSKLVLQLGYSHDIEYVIPDDITVKCEKPTSISITGPSKQKVGQMAAELRSYRPPEPYKGKGVIRVGLAEGEAGEFVVRKEGKKK